MVTEICLHVASPVQEAHPGLTNQAKVLKTATAPCAGRTLASSLLPATSCKKLMEKVRFGVKELWCRKSREATENLNRQKSLGVYHDFACQTIEPTRKQDNRQTRPQKNKKKHKETPLFFFWKKGLDLVSDDAYEMPTELHKPNNNKAAMRVLLISLAALLSLELMTTVQCK